MKKTRILSIFLLIAVLCGALSSCAFLFGPPTPWEEGKLAETFFDKEYLAERGVADLPVPALEGSYFDPEKNILYLNLSRTDFDAYSNAVAEYLRGKEEFPVRGFNCGIHRQSLMIIPMNVHQFASLDADNLHHRTNYEHLYAFSSIPLSGLYDGAADIQKPTFILLKWDTSAKPSGAEYTVEMSFPTNYRAEFLSCFHGHIFDEMTYPVPGTVLSTTIRTCQRCGEEERSGYGYGTEPDKFSYTVVKGTEYLVSGMHASHWRGSLVEISLKAPESGDLKMTANGTIIPKVREVDGEWIYAFIMPYGSIEIEIEHVEHEHTGRWGCGEISHWYEYTCGCPYPDFAELHYDHDNDGFCDACDYEMPAKTCTQPFEWIGNEEGHVMHMLCDCCDAPDVIEPHEDKNGDFVCDICGYVLPEHKHSYSYYKDEITHGWSYTCGCLTPPNVAMHSDGNRDGKCDVCDYPMPPDHTEHTGRWGCGEEAHWYEYTCGCETQDIVELHYDHDNNGLCDACGYELSVRDSYSLTMNNPRWLYEELKPTYYVGEIVSVKIGIVTDTGFLFFVNGEEITDYQDVDGLYWEFTFTMPACDTVVDFKVYDGFLPDWTYAILYQTFWRQNLDAPWVDIRHYYGEFASGAIVAMIDAGGYDTYLWKEEIGDTVIQYYDGNRITVLYENVFYTLTEAYENGYLTLEEIQTIANMHNNGLV